MIMRCFWCQNAYHTWFYLSPINIQVPGSGWHKGQRDRDRKLIQVAGIITHKWGYNSKRPLASPQAEHSLQFVGTTIGKMGSARRAALHLYFMLMNL